MASATVSAPRVAPVRSSRGPGRGARTRARASREPPPRADGARRSSKSWAPSRSRATSPAPSRRTTTPPPPAAPRRPAACVTGTSCVSTSSFRTPANYLPPWEYLESDADAFQSLVRTLRRRPGAVVRDADPARGYVAATLEYPDGADDYEFFFTDDGSKTVLFRAQSRVNRASPPGCFTPGCVNGPRNRARVEDIRRELGWLGLETDEDKKWVPLLLH